MAYDEVLAGRIRDLIGAEPGLTEQKMFGGLAFLIGGNMAIAASGQGGLLVRVDPDQSDALVAETAARPMEMRGREMRGWLRVGADDVASAAELARWAGLGTRPMRGRCPQSAEGSRDGCARSPHSPRRRKAGPRRSARAR